MRFLECYVENFGKLQGFRYTFDAGLNTILADNGFGKSTLAAFLKCMLYGMEDTKRQDLAENDRKHYMPWQSGRCGGYLAIEHEGRRYKIERSFAAKASEDTFALYNLDTGRLSDDYTTLLGEEMLGIDRDGFERTLFLSERRLSGKNDNKTVSARLSELVGCDGDIGGVDAAMKKLDEKRKYYKKTGGRGHIDELAANISVYAQNISALERAREDSRRLETMLTEQKAEILTLEDRLAKLEAERESLRMKKSKQALIEQYYDKQTKLVEDKKRLDKLRAKFGEEVPTADEVEAATYKLREARRLKAFAEQSVDDGEFAALDARFGGKCDLGEIEMAAASAERLVACREELNSIGNISAGGSKCFSKRVPTRTELIEIKKNNAKIPAICGIIAIIAAIPLLFVALYVGIIAMVIGAASLAAAIVISAAYSKKLEEFLAGLSDEPLPEKSERHAYLDMLIAKLDEEETKRTAAQSAQRRVDDLIAEIAERERALRELLSRIGASAANPVAEIASVRAEYIKYYQMSLSITKNVEERANAKKQSDELYLEVSEFLGRFEELGETPFETLKDMLVEYTFLTSSVAEREAECAALRQRYGIEENAESYSPERMIEVEAKIRECEGDLQARRREYTAAELRLASEAESYERVYEFRERMADLAEQKAIAENELDTVLGAKKFISAAMENMTTKYLGRTREGFAKYREMIEGSGEREFLLDTSFALSVTDGGATHPEEAYSRGTRDLYAIATRLALSDALYIGELPPIILDDPFTALDDGKLGRALDLIEKIAKERQVLYFTCQKSRKPE